MAQDHLSYKRATSVSLVGLTIQIVIWLALLLYARFGQDPAAMTGSFSVLLGVPIWLSLALVFHQHRLERLEALEAEAYRSSSAAQASVFEEAGADQTVQATKLAWMHKWFLPAVSLIVGTFYLAIGAIRFLMTRSLTEYDGFNAPVEMGWAIAIGIGVAVIGFIFARFVAGMAKQRVWGLLHAGSASAVGAALIGFALAIAHFFSAAIDYETIIRILPTIVAFFMIALGVEIYLNFILNLYRPRRAGETQRPAFDSRVLAFIAAPDRLAESISDAVNYQFGFDVSSTWFYRLLARSIGALLVLALVVMWAMSCFTIVKPFERGILLHNGRIARVLDSGLHVKMPWPLGRVEKFPAYSINELEVGARRPTQEGPILWTNQHSANERMFLVQPTSAANVIPSERARATDMSLLVAEVPIFYRVSDLEKYLRLGQDGPSGRREEIRSNVLRSVAASVVMRHMATRSVDQILGAERRSIADRLHILVQSEFDRIDAGVQVLSVALAGAHPETEVSRSFEGVITADQRRESEIEQARTERIRSLAQVAGRVEMAERINAELDVLESLRSTAGSDDDSVAALAMQEQKIIDMIADAGGEASDLIGKSRSDRWRFHMSARSRLASSAGRVAAYRAAPYPYRTSKYLEALAEMARTARVFIVPGDSIRVDLDYEETGANITGFSSSLDDVQIGN